MIPIKYKQQQQQQQQLLSNARLYIVLQQTILSKILFEFTPERVIKSTKIKHTWFHLYDQGRARLSLCLPSQQVAHDGEAFQMYSLCSN